MDFGQDQTAWQCRQLRSCETFPDTFPLKSEPFEDVDFIAELRRDRSSLTKDIWPWNVAAFAPARLIREMEKCIALAGIAEEIHESAGDISSLGCGVVAWFFSCVGGEEWNVPIAILY